MAHAFLKQTFSPRGGFRIENIAFIAGFFLLFNSLIAARLYPGDEIVDLSAAFSALFMGLPLVIATLKDLLARRVELNELAAVSFTATFCTGQYATASAIAFFMIVSSRLEIRAESSAGKSVEALMRLSPDKARVQNGDGFTERDASALRKNDLVQILPGDRIPGDGIVVSGCGTVDEAAITGESVPVLKSVDSTVYSGTINNSGILLVKITADNTDSVIAKIRKLIDHAEKSRTPVMKMIDRYASYYTPLLLMIAAMVFFISRSPDRAIALLIVACPCTVILAGPAAMISALGAASRYGVIIRDVSVLETARNVSTVVFDKTGTLTYGKLAVAGISAANGYDTVEILRYAGSLEQYSRHPSARAVTEECRRRGMSLLSAADVVEIAGMGIRGTVGNHSVSVGSVDWIVSLCYSPEIDNTTGEAEGSRLYVLIDNRFAGTIGLLDEIRQEAASVILSLRSMPIQTILMMTGDRRAVAEKTAAIAGCDFEAEVLPQRKLEYIQQAQALGQTVAMVGDGVNDAPALAAGNVSIAMGLGGTDAAIHSASIVLVNDNIDRIPFIFRLSKKTVSITRQNIIFSILYIVTMALLSTGGFISPLLAAALHSGGTLIVMLNSARLLRVGITTV